MTQVANVETDASAPSPEEIELMNAHGPFSHSVWTGRGLRISGEESLSGRGEFLAGLIRKSIVEHFDAEKLADLSILDVGCYDGWILEQLSDLPFGRLVGVEPRPKNIEKGRAVREILSIPSRVEYRVGDIDSIGDESFDVVICTGLLHHLESHAEAIRRLAMACKELLFLETVCLSSKHITRAFRHEIEMKDLVYMYKDVPSGLSGQKLESSYNDGSAASLSVVSVPSVESLAMYLDVAGFTDVKVAADADRYRAIWGRDRPHQAVCLTAVRGRAVPRPQDAWVRDYERGLAETVMPRQWLVPLYERFCLGRPSRFRLFAMVTSVYIKAKTRMSRWIRPLFRMWSHDRYELEILKNVRHNPVDKLALEYGKLLYHDADYLGAVDVLKTVTQRVNADWRSVYRALFLLSCAHTRLGEDEQARRYESLCSSCNPGYPISDLRDVM